MGIKKIKSRYYRYPTLEERVHLKDEIPSFKRFDFKFDLLESFLNVEGLLEMKRKQFLMNWQSVFSNKLFHLSETLTFIHTHYNRGFKYELNKNNQRELVDWILFDYYTEIYYYYFFSTLDVLAQMINEFFNLKKTEQQVEFNSRLIKNIGVEFIKNTLSDFNNNIAKSRELRNSFTHRFPKNQYDFRMKIDEEKQTLYGGESGIIMKSNEFFKNISKSSILLHELLLELTQQMK